MESFLSKTTILKIMKYEKVIHILNGDIWFDYCWIINFSLKQIKHPYVKKKYLPKDWLIFI